MKLLCVCLTCYITVSMKSLFLPQSLYLRDKFTVFMEFTVSIIFVTILMMGPINCKSKRKPVHQSVNSSAYSVLNFFSLVVYQLILASYLKPVQLRR